MPPIASCSSGGDARTMLAALYRHYRARGRRHALRYIASQDTHRFRGQGEFERIAKGLLLATTLCATACGSGATDRARTVYTDSAGVEVVTNAGADRALDWRIERVWSAGGVEDDRFSLTRLAPYQVAADSAGRIYVLDVAGRRVLVLSAAGALADTLGREGSGPGELRMPLALMMEEGDTLAVLDLGNGGLVRWSAEGEPVDRVRTEVFPWTKSEVTPNGMLVTTRRRDADGTVWYELTLRSPAGERGLARVQQPPTRVANFPSCGAAGITVTPLFAPELRWDAQGGRVAVYAGGPYVIDVYEGERRVRSIRRDLGPRPVDEAMAVREAGAGWNHNDCMVPAEEVVRGTGYAEVLPSLMAIALSPAGEVWALRGRVADEPSRIDIFAPDGAYLGTLPPGSPFPAAFLPGDRILAVDKDSLDVPRITLYRIARR